MHITASEDDVLTAPIDEEFLEQERKRRSCFGIGRLSSSFKYTRGGGGSSSHVYEWLRRNTLLVMMLGGVILGFVVGSGAAVGHPSDRAVQLIGFPGNFKYF